MRLWSDERSGCPAWLAAERARWTRSQAGSSPSTAVPAKVYDGALTIEAPNANDNEALAALTEWAARLSPLKVLAPSSPHAETAVDLSAMEDAADPEKIGAILKALKGARGVRGGIVGSDEGVRAAIAAGLEFIVAEPVLPPLLAAVRAAAETAALSEVGNRMTEIKPSEIEALLEIFESSSWGEMRLKVDGLEMFVSKTPGARPNTSLVPSAASSAAAHSAPVPPAAPAPRAEKHSAAPDHWVMVRAPNLGTFYRSPKPGAPPYVKVGQRIDPASELCLIEVMKLFTSVIAGISGVVREVLVEDSELVEFDQALFLIEPDA